MANPVPATAKTQWWAQEDWLAVWRGAFFLLAVVIGFRPVMPAMKWTDGGSLVKVFNTESVVGVLWIGLIYLITSLPGIAALQGNTRQYVTGFPIVFLLAWIAQIMAGNSTVSYW